MMRLAVVSCCMASIVAVATGFAPVPQKSLSSFAVKHNAVPTVLFEKKQIQDFDMHESIMLENSKNRSNDVQELASATSVLWLASVTPAHADSPDWGIFEGRTGSLLHPIMMGSLLLFSLNTGFLGWKWRRQRTMGDEISALKQELAASVVPPEEGAEDSAPEEPDDLALKSEIDKLVEERKELAAEGNREKHYGQGALLAFLGTAFAIEGPLNTFARAGKLFPGPHLYVGASLVVLWAAAAACVPQMQKGNDTARTIHITANAAGIGLFGWQVFTGIPILQKVIEKTSWP